MFQYSLEQAGALCLAMGVGFGEEAVEMRWKNFAAENTQVQLRKLNGFYKKEILNFNTV